MFAISRPIFLKNRTNLYNNNRKNTTLPAVWCKRIRRLLGIQNILTWLFVWIRFFEPVLDFVSQQHIHLTESTRVISNNLHINEISWFFQLQLQHYSIQNLTVNQQGNDIETCRDCMDFTVDINSCVRSRHDMSGICSLAVNSFSWDLIMWIVEVFAAVLFSNDSGWDLKPVWRLLACIWLQRKMWFYQTKQIMTLCYILIK